MNSEEYADVIINEGEYDSQAVDKEYSLSGALAAWEKINTAMRANMPVEDEHIQYIRMFMLQLKLFGASRIAKSDVVNQALMDRALFLRKSNDYSSSIDVYSNFKERSMYTDVPVLKVIWVDVNKHWIAVTKQQMAGTVLNESLSSRIDDIRALLLFLKYIGKEVVPVEVNEGTEIPVKAYATDAGFDLCSSDPDFILGPGATASVGTGVRIFLHHGFEGQIRPKSGIAQKHKVTVLNSPGTIDAGYSGEIRVLLINHGTFAYPVRRGDKIAQLVVCALPDVRLIKKHGESVGSVSSRGEAGFGSTGV